MQHNRILVDVRSRGTEEVRRTALVRPGRTQHRLPAGQGGQPEPSRSLINPKPQTLKHQPETQAAARNALHALMT